MKYALLSVTNKEGIVEFAQGLSKLGFEIISTGGTGELLLSYGVPVMKIEEFSGDPEILGGRVKTLGRKVLAGVLGKRLDQGHKKEMAHEEFPFIDLVCVNLYEFTKAVKSQVSHEEIIEKIDIGGPTLLRAAAKNYEDVLVVSDPRDYGAVLSNLSADSLTKDFRQYLSGKAFNLVAMYDLAISSYFSSLNNPLRYGENPHQRASVINFGNIFERQLSGKELSYNNYLDLKAGLNILGEFKNFSCAVAIKHGNPCGVGTGNSLYEAYVGAYECDNESIFGGIVLLNGIVTEDLAYRLNETFLEVIGALDFTEKALEVLKTKKNLRIIILKDNYGVDGENIREFEIRDLGEVLLSQEQDLELLNNLEVVSNHNPRESEMDDLVFAFKVCKHLKSNGIVIAKNGATVGICGGQTSRIKALKGAVSYGGSKVVGAVMASDGFFPFGDSVEYCASVGIVGVIEPGGSLKDEESIVAANKGGISLVFTAMRHFKH